MQRQMQAELAEGDLGQQHRAGASPRDRVRRRRRLGDGLAGRQENFSRTCWMTNQLAGTRSSVSVMSSPSLCRRPAQHGHADGLG